jgi:hypothetical protein
MRAVAAENDKAEPRPRMVAAPLVIGLWLVRRLVRLGNVFIVIIKRHIANVATHDVVQVGTVPADGIDGNLDAGLAERAKDVKHGMILSSMLGRGRENRPPAETSGRRGAG